MFHTRQREWREAREDNNLKALLAAHQPTSNQKYFHGWTRIDQASTSVSSLLSERGNQTIPASMHSYLQIMPARIVFTILGPPVLWWTLSILLPSPWFRGLLSSGFSPINVTFRFDRPRFCLLALLRSLFLILLRFHLSHCESGMWIYRYPSWKQFPGSWKRIRAACDLTRATTIIDGRGRARKPPLNTNN